jgi:hypothetical protein
MNDHTTLYVGVLWYLANGSGGILLCRRVMYRPPIGYGWCPMSRCDSGKRTYPSYAETLAALDRFAAKGILNADNDRSHTRTLAFRPFKAEVISLTPTPEDHAEAERKKAAAQREQFFNLPRRQVGQRITEAG